MMMSYKMTNYPKSTIKTRLHSIITINMNFIFIFSTRKVQIAMEMFVSFPNIIILLLLFLVFNVLPKKFNFLCTKIFSSHNTVKPNLKLELVCTAIAAKPTHKTYGTY